ncbi:hypothetical protein ABB37_04312 [Leptomonas pyrrhocoris]|uniref:Xrn1 N-terminal domain-containing protein n=1 Tax=Leptomonas pyrrhocoris TaxID=157538 RepID=A0A0N0DVV5_LEPPY|nr:hypothetical protein ABB37_04312 [Leptomonas pyrrhocoris]XP_015659350.1 hypothetical protein ABB37_04312 [Leptomonas pyrrhocoris]KPA80910.1 hypothetical protein ABB37_04312 [Leptomonas pyrrhocoris]KPA80911.1 hypothetical protein ABB37_04312 [Leptomonas pyrrhocoris]|eukprot:XP_015659349.1 hypothetical protein ABB37_04312 [Leptomonas pyrrhocoris]
MGVKGLWNYVEHHNVQYAYPNKNARATCYGVNPRHLFIDMNAVLHMSYEPTKPTTAATLRAVVTRVDELLLRVRPEDTLVLVFDGVAPVLKIKTQKERRRSLPVNAPCPASISSSPDKSNQQSTTAAAATSGAISSAAYTSDLTRDGVPLRREEILCGSEFVLACEEYITSHLQRRKAQQQRQYSWRQLRVSGCRTAGEGEVKISGLLRQLWAANVADGTYKPDDAITFVGNDSDLILVAMVATPYSYFTLVDPFDYSLTSLHELMEHWSNAVPNPPLSSELLPSYRVDFVFLMLLAGSDYYEGIRADSVALWRRYRHLRANEGFFRRALLSGPHLDLDLEFVRAVFARNGSMRAQLLRVPRNKRKTAKSILRSGGGGGSSSATDGIRLLSAALWSLKSYVTGSCVDYRFRVPQEGGCPSVGSLRSAAQTRGLSRMIGAGARSAAAEEEANAETHPLFTPLEQCLAVLGMRGRYSLELRRALHTCTADEGHTLTTSSSITYMTETVRRIMAAVDASRLTTAERLLHTPSALRAESVEGGGSEEGAFMLLAAIPPRKAAQASPAVATDAKEDHSIDPSEGDPDEESGDGSAAS